ncbi:glycoside hydrolase family 132 protein [Cadophora sp. DSE1049]|nr:glycoside hydrolase family 132 protein [Cadophora sp. DSE1049]
MKFSRLALLSAASLSVAQPHNHVHKHPARHGSPLEGRDYATTTTVPGPTVTVYELNGDFIPWDEVEAGIKSGKYVLVGDKITTAITPTTTSTTPTSTPIPTTSSSPAAKFLEQKVSTSTTPTSTYVAPTTSSTPTPTPTKSASVVQAASDSSSSSSGATGVNAKFPSGEIDCDDFDALAKYGAVAADWLGLGGYLGVQITPSYSIGAAAISYIETAISGGGCVKNSFCSYACPPGYQKAQWPEAQGNTGQSIGGIYCNAKGKLELTRDGYSTLCMAGVGGVKAQNKLSKNVAVCRTDYPGTESETDFTNVAAGATVDITCPDSKTSYVWQGMATTAQYYINPSGVSVEDGCQWGTPGSNMGNYAPVNVGVGRGSTGETFISIFPNKPTNPDGVLDFNIKITGGVSGKCSYEGGTGKYYNNGVESPTGCTVAVSGTAVFEFY